MNFSAQDIMQRRRRSLPRDEPDAEELTNLRVARIIEDLPPGAPVWPKEMAVKAQALEHLRSIEEYLLKLRVNGNLRHNGGGYVKV